MGLYSLSMSDKAWIRNLYLNFVLFIYLTHVYFGFDNLIFEAADRGRAISFT